MLKWSRQSQQSAVLSCNLGDIASSFWTITVTGLLMQFLEIYISNKVSVLNPNYEQYGFLALDKYSECLKSGLVRFCTHGTHPAYGHGGPVQFMDNPDFGHPKSGHPKSPKTGR